MKASLSKLSKGRVPTVNKYFRLIIMLSLFLGIVFVAQNRVAWANQSSGQSLSARGVEQFVSAAKPDCKDNNKNKDKCQGTVKPPPKKLLIPVTGDYSVGGFCTLSITFTDPAYSMDASVKTPLPRELPDTVHKVEQGCLLTYFNTAQRIPELAASAGSATICFAALPEKQMVIYFYNIDSSTPEWSPLETTVANGTACAAATRSGLYVATFTNP